MPKRGVLAATIILLLQSDLATAQPRDPFCGMSPRDWCASPPDDPCGAHRNERECRADPRCQGMPYRGESVVACKPDGSGFWSNCPAVGCVFAVSRPAVVADQPDAPVSRRRSGAVGVRISD